MPTSEYPPNYDRWSTPPGGAPGYANLPNPTPPPKKHTVMVVVLVGLAVLVLALCIGGLFLAQGDPPAVKHVTTPTTAGSKVAVKTVPPGKPQIVSGEYLVGHDVTAGRYRTAGAVDGAVPLCAWTTAKDTGYANVIDVGAINGLHEQAYVTLKDGEYFRTTGCLPWVKQ